MAISNYLPFAITPGANVSTQTAYESNPEVIVGYQSGEALSAHVNKAIRQASMGSTVLAQYIQNILNVDCLDDGVIPLILSNLATSIITGTHVVDNSTTVNVMNANLPITPISMQNGMVITIVPNMTNTTSVTLNLNSLGVYPVVSNAGVLRGGELIQGSGFQLVFLSSLGTGSWLLLNYQTTCITQAVGESSTKMASTAYVMNSGFAPNDSPSLTGNARSITPIVGDNSTKIATTAYVQAAGFAPNDSPSLTGIPRSVTPPYGDNSTRIATTAFVQAALAQVMPTGTRLLFSQAYAPTGWTTDTTDIASNRLLRVVPGGGGGGGGYHDSWYMNVVPAHSHSFVTGGENVPHIHYDTGHAHSIILTNFGGGGYGGFGNAGWINTTLNYASGIANAQLTTENAAHGHYGSTDNGSSQVIWQPRYTNCIIGIKN